MMVSLRHPDFAASVAEAPPPAPSTRCDILGRRPAQISQRVEGLVVTLGHAGCEVWIRGEKTVVPPVQPHQVVDPTGCGDAWRSALLYGLEQGWPLERCARLGNEVGAIKVASRGPQNYTLDRLRPSAAA